MLVVPTVLPFRGAQRQSCEAKNLGGATGEGVYRELQIAAV